MKLSSVIDRYGDLDVIAVIPNKAKYNLSYEEKVIPKSLLLKEYGLKEVI